MRCPQQATGQALWSSGVLLSIIFICGRGLSRADSRSELGEPVKPALGQEMAEVGNNPTLRYPVMLTSGFNITYGWLEVRRDAIRYQVVKPSKKADQGFESPRQGLSKLKRNKNWLSFTVEGKDRHIIYLDPGSWGSIHSGFGLAAAAERNVTFTMSILQALRDFDAVAATFKPQPEPRAPAQTSSIAQPAAPAVPSPAAQPPEPPTILLLDPALSSTGQVVQASGGTLTIRGAAMDSSGLPVVTINGRHANMKPRSANAVDFWSDPITLVPVDNSFQVVASNAAKAESRFAFIVQFNPPRPISPPSGPKPLGKAEILDLLRNYVPGARVIALVKERGIDFVPSDEDLKQISDAGGGDDLIETLRQAAAKH